MQQIELYVSGATTGTTIGQIELYGDEPISLNYSISDVKDISKRNSNYSQSFTVPASKNNNILFNHIFNIGSDSSFNPSKKVSSYILVDSLMVIQGNLQLTNIKVKNKNPISYDVIIYGETDDLVKAIGDSYLTDLDFSELNHNRSAENIEASWTANTANLGYYYPLIDYGYDLDITELNSGVLSLLLDSGDVTVGTSLAIKDTSKSWVTNAFVGYNINIISGTGAGQTRVIGSNTGIDINLGFYWIVIPDTTSRYTITKSDTTNPYNTTGGGLKPSIFKPALSNTYLLRKIFNNAGFSIEGDFVDSDVFAQTIIPYNGVDDLSFNSEDIATFQAYLSAPFEKHPSGTFTAPNLVDFPFTDDNVTGSDRSGVYSASTQTYISPAAGTTSKFYVHLSYDYNLTYLPAGESVFDVFYIRYYRSSFSLTNPYYQDVIPVDRCPGFYFMGPAGTTSPPAGSALGPHSITSSASPLITLANGEMVWVKIYVANSTNVLYPIYDTNSAFYNRVYTNGVVNNYIEYNNYVPKKIKQLDYVKSIINKFNLMVVPNKYNNKLIKLIPRSEYYDQGKVKDWSNKLDVSSQIEEVVISEQQSKQIYFTDKADKDYYNTLYTDDTSKVYGEYTYFIDNEWLDPTSKKTIDTIFSPTPLDKVFGTEDLIIPKITKVDNNGVYGKTESNIRFLRKNQNLTPILETIKILGGNTYNGYPYAGHLSSPFSDDTNPIDYNFGTIEYAFYNSVGFNNLQSITPNNLVNLYWKEYLDDINDKNSKLIKCKIKLTANDIAQFNYNDSIFIEGLTDDGGHYFIVNKINYIPTSSEPSVVELIKVNRIPSIANQSSSITTNTTPVKRNSLSLGGAVVEAKNSFGAGDVSISLFSRNSYANGTNNIISNNSPNSFIQGDNNTIGDYVLNGYILGNNNQIGEIYTGLTSGATGTSITYISGVTLLGVNNYTATTSDTVYVPNIQFTSSAGTINGVSITSIVAGSNLWSAGTGSNSIKANNNTTNIASGIYSYVEGVYSISSGQASHSEGGFTTAIGENSHAEGTYTIASGNTSHAEGIGTTSAGYGSHSEGNNTTALGSGSHVEGVDSLASGESSHAEGNGTTTFGINSHAEGSQTTAFGNQSHAEGFETTASGNVSHSEGRQTTALANYSHAGGYLSVASGQTSFVHGLQSVAGGASTIVLGDNITGTTANTLYTPDIIVAGSKSIKTSNGGGQLNLDYGSNEVMLSTDNGGYSAAMLYLTNGYTELSDYTSNSSLNMYYEGIMNLGKSFPSISSGLGDTFSNISSISSSASTFDVIAAGGNLENTVIIGGTSLTATRSNTTYTKYIAPYLPIYANDAAADADTLLSSGGLYKITGSRIVYQKP